jgi:hypothetical protein
VPAMVVAEPVTKLRTLIRWFTQSAITADCWLGSDKTIPEGLSKLGKGPSAQVADPEPKEDTTPPMIFLIFWPIRSTT